jgi:hypothetical protein
MSTEQKGHYGANALNKLHGKVGDTTEGGACLTGHQASFRGKTGQCTCNYRYQGYEHAKENSAIKDKLHSYTTARTTPVPTSAPTGENGLFPGRYCATLAPPGPGDWDITGPTSAPISRGSFRRGAVTVPLGMNFTQDTWPYWNNAHHLIPKGTLKESITKEDTDNPGVSDLIQQCLLEAKYNINHKVNMLLMPQDLEVANMLGMPRHLQLQEKDGSVQIAVGNHPVYNEYVSKAEGGLNKIVQDYAKICKDAIADAKKNEHPLPKAELDKKKLEALSEQLLKFILGGGAVGSLDALAKAKNAAAKAAGY